MCKFGNGYKTGRLGIELEIYKGKKNHFTAQRT